MSSKNVWQYAPALMALGIVVYVLVSSEPQQLTPSQNQLPATTSPATTTLSDDLTAAPSAVEAYVRQNIATLSPTPAVLGGTFYVTKVEVQNGSGVVWYEDGHIALVADFTYSNAVSGTPQIESFTVR